MGLKHPYLARHIDADTIGLYTSDATKLLTLDRTLADYTYICGGHGVNTGIKLKANIVDAAPMITMIPTAQLILKPSTGQDVWLNTGGAGQPRFGNYTGGAATDSIGYISIKDDDGTARKLMVQA